jgi:hypothetical protein
VDAACRTWLYLPSKDLFGSGIDWTIPFLELILAFGLGMEWNETVRRNDIFPPDAEPTCPADSAGPSGTGDCHTLIN